VYGEVAHVYRKAVAELVGRLAKELADVLHEVVVTSGKAAPVLGRSAAQTALMDRDASWSVWAMYAPSTLGR
jgi:hypothetical protein